MGSQLKRIILTLTILMKDCLFRVLPLPQHPEAPAKTLPQERPREPAEITQQKNMSSQIIQPHFL